MFCSAAVEVAELQKPHGGVLVDVRAPADKHESIVASCTKTVECTDRQACDVELLSYGYVLASVVLLTLSVVCLCHSLSLPCAIGSKQ